MRSKTVVAICFLLLMPSVLFASELTMNWSGFNSMMPQNLEASASASYNGKIYVFGGFLDDTARNNTYIYDTVSGSWTAGTGMPTARYYCSAAEIGGKIYVVGGGKLQSGTSTSLDNCEIYDPSSNSWATGAALPAPLRGLSSVAANGKLYVLGGKTNSGYSNTVYEYNPGGNSWAVFPTAPISAAYGGAVFNSSTNRIYYIGGIIDDNYTASSYSGKAYSMDASTGAWDAAAISMPFKASNFATAFDPASGIAYLVGGNFYSGKDTPYPDVQIFNTAKDTFSSGTLALLPSPLSRHNSSASVIGDWLYLIGGTGINVVDIYTISTDSWGITNPPLTGDISGGASAAIAGKFYIADGGFFSPLKGAVYAYDPSSGANGSWSKLNGKDPQPRIYAGFGEYNGKIVIADGMDGNGFLLDTVAIYDSSLDSFSFAPVHDPEPAILSAGAVYDGKLYLFGGRTDPSDDQTLSKKLRILDIDAGSFTTGPDLPSELEQASAVAIGDKIYIFGGSTLTAPDYMNKNVIIFDPVSSTYSQGVAIPYPVYGAAVSSSGTLAIIDSGYYIFYSSNLQGFGGGPTPVVQIYDTQADTFTSIQRPYAKFNHNSAVIGTKYYSTAGEDGSWPSSRLDIANIISSGCSFTCSASASPQSGQKPLAVNFAASVAGSGCVGSASYSWNFGDSVISTEQNPSHTYNNDGSYTWRVTVTWAGQECQKSGIINVSGCSLTCSASAAPASGTAPLDVVFTSSAVPSGCTGTPAYLWNFGDQTAASNLQNPTHSYTKDGTYTWTLTVTADSQSCSKTGTITVGAQSCTLTCEAGAAPDTGTAPLAVAFTASAVPTGCTGTPSYLWNFGDQTAASNLQNTTHSYTADGTYTWTLTVTADDKTCSKTGTITVGTQPCTLTCEAGATPDTGTAPLAVNFTSTATPAGCTGTPSFLWNFGDGGTSQSQTTSHNYTQEGTYTWTLTVAVDGRTCAKEGTVTVGAPVCSLTCGATASPDSGTAPLNVSFTGTATPSAGCTGTPAYLWNFGDGTTSTELNVSHTYSSAGSYDWEFKATLSGQVCSKSGTITVAAYDGPTLLSVSKISNPFRLRVIGDKFKEFAQVLINGIPVPYTKYKSSTYLVAKKGSALKSMVPKGVEVTVIVRNPDGNISNEIKYTRR